MACPRIIRLNVGGALFSTARSTLASCSYFANLLSTDYADLDTASGEAFIDRDGRYFHLVLNYLRSGHVERPQPPLSLDGLLAEAEFFGIEPLVAELQQMRDGPPPPAADEFPELRVDGTGIYVWEDRQQPGLIEAILFEGTPDEPTLVYSRGPCARENLLAMRMTRPLPDIWRANADASTIVAFFTQRFISRGKWQLSGRTVLMTRGSLGADLGSAASAQSNVATVGVLLDGGTDLLLLGPDGASPSNSASLLEQLGLQSWRDAGLATPASASSTAVERSLGGLGGGFKRFRWEPHQ